MSNIRYIEDTSNLRMTVSTKLMRNILIGDRYQLLKIQQTLKGPCWLSDARDWPADIVTDATEESECESQIIKDIMKLTVSRETDQLD